MEVATVNSPLEKLVSLQEFPQIKRRRALRFDFLRTCYARLTNNNIAFKKMNRTYIDALNEITLPAISTVEKRVIDDLKSNGIAFADFSEFFSANFFNVIQDCFYTYQAEFNRNNTSAKSGKGAYLDTVHKAHTFIKNDSASAYLSEPAFAHIASQYMSMIPRFVGSSFWHTRVATGCDRIYSQLWHRDYNDRMLVKIFLYITDVGPQEGYLEYVTGSHGRGPLGQKFDRIGSDGYRAYPNNMEVDKLVAKLPVIKLNTLNSTQKNGHSAPWSNKPSVIQCIAPKATLIFADTFGLHRGGFVQEGHRDMIMITYSTHFNIHKPHFSVSQGFANELNPFMRMAFGISAK